METVVVNNIVKRYGSLTALAGVSFSAEEGELFGFIGPDGAGKTTLFHILATLITPDEGNARIDSVDVIGGYRTIRSGIGYMPERFSLYPDLSVEENLEFFASLFQVTIEENYDFIAPVYRQIEPFKKRQTGKLSGGMKQKLALSCAMIHRPRVLLLDEPTRGVDPVSRKEFWEMLLELKKQGVTILVSTSYMDEANLCDRIALCDRGKFLRIDTPRRIVEQFDSTIYALKGENMYHTLLTARNWEGTRLCYTFGETHHILFKEKEPDVPAFLRFMKERSGEVVLHPIVPGIEDCFMQLIDHE